MEAKAVRSAERRITFSNYLDRELYAKLDEISKNTRISKSKLLDKSVELLIEHYNENNGTVKYSN